MQAEQLTLLEGLIKRRATEDAGSVATARP